MNFEQRLEGTMFPMFPLGKSVLSRGTEVGISHVHISKEGGEPGPEGGSARWVLQG